MSVEKCDIGTAVLCEGGANEVGGGLSGLICIIIYFVLFLFDIENLI